jgi:hypothetical protein
LIIVPAPQIDFSLYSNILLSIKEEIEKDG